CHGLCCGRRSDQHCRRAQAPPRSRHQCAKEETGRTEMTAPILLVTGASRGIGAAIAKLAGSRGFDVAVNYLRDRKSADAVVAAIESKGRRAIAVQADMASEADIVRMFKAVDDGLGRLTHLVYNTGITGPMSRVDAIDAKAVRDVFQVNVVGAFLCAKAAIVRMSTKHRGAAGESVCLSSAMARPGGAERW